MKRCVLFLLIFTAALAAYGETVLVFTRNSLNPEIPGVQELQAAVEDGVMETLFDAGHIVFNAGVIETNDKLKIPSERLSVRLAKSGGAFFLLEIDLAYFEPSAEDTQILPERAEYRLYNVVTGSLLTEGRLQPEDVDNKPDTPVDEVCLAMGESIASGTLPNLRR